MLRKRRMRSFSETLKNSGIAMGPHQIVDLIRYAAITAGAKSLIHHFGQDHLVQEGCLTSASSFPDGAFFRAQEFHWPVSARVQPEQWLPGRGYRYTGFHQRVPPLVSRTRQAINGFQFMQPVSLIFNFIQLGILPKRSDHHHKRLGSLIVELYGKSFQITITTSFSRG